MKSIINIKHSIKRYYALLVDIALALDTNPTELLHAEVHQLKQEIAELKHQLGLFTHS